MTCREDVEKIIQKRRKEIDRLTKAIERAEEKIHEKEDEILVLNDLAEKLPAVQPALPEPVESGEGKG